MIKLFGLGYFISTEGGVVVVYWTKLTTVVSIHTVCAIRERKLRTIPLLQNVPYTIFKSPTDIVIEWGHDSHIAFELSPMREIIVELSLRRLCCDSFAPLCLKIMFTLHVTTQIPLRGLFTRPATLSSRIHFTLFLNVPNFSLECYWLRLHAQVVKLCR